MTEADKALIRAALKRAEQRFDETCRPDLPCQFCRAIAALDREPPTQAEAEMLDASVGS